MNGVGKNMKLRISILTILFLSSSAYANKSNKDRERLKQLSEKATRLYSVAEEIRIVPSGSTEIEVIRSVFADDVTSSADCKRYDVNDEFQNIHYWQSEEVVKENDPGYSTIIDGVKHEGRVVGRTVEYCFAE